MRLAPSLALAAWLESAHLGASSAADVAGRVQGEAPNCLVVLPDGGVHPLAEAVSVWVEEAVRATLALPVAGDPVGVAGPASFTSAAVDSGEAVLLPRLALGLVPEEDARTLVWRGYVATPPPWADAREADRRLRQTLVEATRRLVELDVASWQPEIPDLLMNLHHGPGVPLPRHWEPRRVETVERALVCREIVRLALADHGGAVTSYEMEQRRAALRDLDAAARHALVAGCSDSLALR